MNTNTYDWTGEKILVADDDAYSYLLLEKVLRKTGVSVSFAFDGEEALNKLKKDKTINIAILDIIMPKLNGFQVVERIKKIRPELICIAYTADVVRFDIERCKELGFHTCITKPVLPTKFLRILNDAMVLRKLSL